jgi:UDP-sugar pyrophosphorylase
MTSNDTNAKTIALLAKHNNFGMDGDQITIVQQGQGVPALENNNAKIACSGNKILTKPHGHGDVHALMYSCNVAKSWLDSGSIEYVVFFQDTNGLAFHTLPLALGLTTKLNLVMNSLAVPRKAKQAIGGIVQLTKENGDQRYIHYIIFDDAVVCLLFVLP